MTNIFNEITDKLKPPAAGSNPKTYKPKMTYKRYYVLSQSVLVLNEIAIYEPARGHSIRVTIGHSTNLTEVLSLLQEQNTTF